MKRAILSAALAVSFVAGVSAQDKPNFAGTWKPVDSFNRTRITVEGSKMTVTITLAGNSDSTVYILDGTPSKKTMKGPGGKPIEQVYTSKWEGNALVTTITTAAPDPMIEKRWLDADGTMKVERTIILKGKPETSPTSAFKKVELSAQDKPNFAGTWRIDPARSDKYSGGAPPETITVEGSKMTVTRTRAGNSESSFYMLDGTPSKNVSGPPGKQSETIYTSKWEGNVLVTTFEFPLVSRIEKRSIETDGTMRVEAIFNFKKEPKSETGIMVFNKVK